METILSTALVLIREGFESVLLTSMIAAALPDQYRNHINFNFILTWVLTLVAGWIAVDAIWPYIENIEHIMMIVTAAVLVYIFFNSKSIFQHAKEHANEVKDSSIWTIHLTVFLICLREALESTVFLGSQIHTDPWGVVQGLLLGMPVLFALIYAVVFSSKDIKAKINRVMFRYVGVALLLMAGYYLFHVVTEILEQNFGIDLF
jgi:hypothetical protein